MNQFHYKDEIDLREYFDVIRRRWKIITFFAVGLLIIATIMSLLQAPVYEARTTIMTSSRGGGSASTFANLAAAVGKGVPGGSFLSDLSVLLESRAVAAKVVDDLDLRKRIKGWNNPNLKDEQLASIVQSMLQNPSVSGNLIELKVQYTDPKVAAEIVNGYVNALSYYWNKLNYTEAKRKREYIENQLPRVNQDLARIEKQIKSFSLLGVGSPSIKFKRLEREYEIQNNVYKMLRTEYESVKLDESKEFPPASIIDAAVVPKTPVSPRVKPNAFIGLVLGLCIGLFVGFFQEYWENSEKKK